MSYYYTPPRADLEAYSFFFFIVIINSADWNKNAKNIIALNNILWHQNVFKKNKNKVIYCEIDTRSL